MAPLRRTLQACLIGWTLVWTACSATPEDGRGAGEPPIALEGWRRTHSPGLVIYTNATDAAARLALRQVEGFVKLVARFVYGQPFDPPQPARVFIFANRAQYIRFAPEAAAGYAFQSSGFTTTALSIEQSLAGTGTLYHELVHVVLFDETALRFPSWFHEGLAVFFSTSVQRGDVLTVGALPLEAVQQIRVKEPLPLRRLLSSPAAGQRDIGLFYGDAWAFVHFGLLSATLGGRDHRKAFRSFVVRVGRGHAWEPSFEKAFAAGPDEIAVEYESHREKLAGAEVVRLANIPLEQAKPEIVFEPLERLEAARELASLGLIGPSAGRQSAAELFDLLLADDPGDTEARYGAIRAASHRGELERAGELWDGLAPERREGASAWHAEADLCLGRARRLRRSDRENDREAYLARAVDRFQRVLAARPQELSALVGLGRAVVMAEQEEPAEGILALERAVQQAPEWPEIRVDLAELMIRGQAGEAARPHLDYVIEAYPRSAVAKRAKRLRRRLRRAS